MARRLWAESGYGPTDVDDARVYENATAMGIAAIIDHGFCTTDETEGFVHGMSLVTEAVRQIRGTSVNQVPDTALSLMTGGPGDSVVSSALLGAAETL